MPYNFSDFLFKILMIGDTNVGKSSLLLRFYVLNYKLLKKIKKNWKENSYQETIMPTRGLDIVFFIIKKKNLL